MSLFKNDVGRPSNKTIIIRNILKGIAVVVVGAGLVAGGYYLNDYQKKDNDDSKDNKKVVTTSKNSVKRNDESEWEIDNCLFNIITKNLQNIDDIYAFDIDFSRATAGEYKIIAVYKNETMID